MRTAVVTRGGRIAWPLAAVAGCVDAVGYLILFHVFVANMSGNSVKLGADLAGGAWGEAARNGVPVGVFVLGVGAGVLGGEVVQRRGGRHRTAVLLLVEAAMLAVAATWGSAQSPAALQRGFTPPFAAVAVLLVAAMSLQTAALQRVEGRTVRTTYVTGMLTGLATDVAVRIAARLCGRRDGDDEGRSSVLGSGVWLCYLGGAVAGAAGERAWRFGWMVAPIAGLAVVAGADLSRNRRAQRSR